ncbi:uncharacterized protein LOC109809639 [Cajanus cajan]|uniref:Uncharacterized protein n=1 Tax=Cajanus cajan TaxID=3821 RepID=A0A151SSR2_CAJCA|nr:uncharacterized protein LOC109809639 [Cajanus cajan]KYP57808.1 hypothetical protein KK1_004087 [Cajanus cajan]
MKTVSPLEAQAFNYLSFGFLSLLNNFWTWLALSFWRTQTPNPELLPPPHAPIPHEAGPVAVTGPAPSVPVDGPTKGKFTLYFEDDEIERECESEVTVTEEIDGRGEWWESWESSLRMRRGENEKGWYTCQDLTALNGSVVKLWMPSAFTTRDSSTCVFLYANNTHLTNTIFLN